MTEELINVYCQVQDCEGDGGSNKCILPTGQMTVDSELDNIHQYQDQDQECTCQRRIHSGVTILVKPWNLHFIKGS